MISQVVNGFVPHPRSPSPVCLWCASGVPLRCLSGAPQVGVRSNISDMQNDPFYNFIEDTYIWHIAAMAAVLYAAGGFPFIVWGLVRHSCLCLVPAAAMSTVPILWGVVLPEAH